MLKDIVSSKVYDSTEKLIGTYFGEPLYSYTVRYKPTAVDIAAKSFFIPLDITDVKEFVTIIPHIADNLIVGLNCWWDLYRTGVHDEIRKSENNKPYLGVYINAQQIPSRTDDMTIIVHLEYTKTID